MARILKIISDGVPIVAHQKQIRLVSMRLPRSEGWGSGVVVGCGVDRRCCWDPTLLWLWCRPRPAAVAPIPPLAWNFHMPQVWP